MSSILKTSKILNQYNYFFPKELIAQKPASPRNSARLLVYARNKEQITYDTFINLGKYLPKHAVLVFNETKVIPARVELKKATGGKVKILYIATEQELVKVMADRNIPIGSQLYLGKKSVFSVERQQEQFYFLRPLFSDRSVESFLEKHGTAPLPPYIKHSPLVGSKLRKEYQTVFAKYSGSVAAPTASLHFTKSLLRRLRQQGFGIEFVTLHVNLGTFAPLREAQLQEGKLHSEYYEINRKTLERLNQYKKEGRLIIAVGTTVVRTLESASDTRRNISQEKGDTNLFIRPGYDFKFVDGIITNFHVPQSSLLMLIAAFVGQKKILSLYQKAIRKKFRLFSFGDGMLII